MEWNEQNKDNTTKNKYKTYPELGIMVNLETGTENECS